MPEQELTDDEVIDVLNQSVTLNLDPGTYEIGLVLGGSVSAGAYTAGFLDKLIEVLDAWYIAKARGHDVPKHDVRLRIATGASGGAVCAAILARALASKFDPATPSAGEETLARNPFYATWVTGVDISDMADTSDIQEDGVLTSLLNGRGLDQATRDAVNYQGNPLPQEFGDARPYVDNPFAVIATLGNMTGVPYAIKFDDGRELVYKSHADFARFACDVSYHNNLKPPDNRRPDTFYVQQNGRGAAVNWATLGNYARGSSAFPLALPAIPLSRPRVHYEYRMVMTPGDADRPATARRLTPVWENTNVGAQYSLLSVDGGTFNNEPIELARTYLSGVLGRNPRDRKRADRGVILVDPLANTSALGNAAFTNLFDLGGAVAGAMIGQSRYATADLLMMADEDVFSRYLVTPVRGAFQGDVALATAGLAGFAGFFEESYRHHDFMLGRENCRTFLEKEFALDAENPIFLERWTDAQRTEYGAEAGADYLPVIPLVGDAALPDGPTGWPKGRMTARRARNRLKKRVTELVEKVADDAIDNEYAGDLAIWLGKGKVAEKILDPLEREFDKFLRDWHL